MQRERRAVRRRFRDRDRQFAAKPVEMGKEYDVEVQEVSRRGDGVARIQGLVTFIPNAKLGDHLKIRITKISRRFAEAEIVTGSSESETE